MIIVLTGFSAAGKDTLAKILEKKGIYNIISTTTRPMRKGEQQGNPYWFISKEQFLEMIKNEEFVEYRTYNTLLQNIPDVWYYGIQKKEIKKEKINVAVLDMNGAIKFKKYFKDEVLIFFIDASEKERRRRAIIRGDYDKYEFERRLLDDKKQFTKNIIKKEVDFIIKSTIPEKNAEEILTKIKNIYKIFIE